MKFLSYTLPGQPVRPGVLHDGQVWELPDAEGLLDVIARGLADALEVADTALGSSNPHALDAVTVRLPFEPVTFRDFMTFEEHTAGTAGANGISKEWFGEPVFYFSNPASFLGPDVDVAAPARARRVDFELEVGAVVGREGSDLSAAGARDHLFGLTIVNDWSARDIQAQEMKVGLGPAKGKDFATSMGPYIVTLDELASARTTDGRYDLEMAVRVNGRQVGNDTLANMSWTFEELLVHASADTRVRPGDLLGSGTAGNGGCLLELELTGAIHAAGIHDLIESYLRPGDVVEMEVERLGSLRTMIRPAQHGPHTPPPARSPYRPRQKPGPHSASHSAHADKKESKP